MHLTVVFSDLKHSAQTVPNKQETIQSDPGEQNSELDHEDADDSDQMESLLDARSKPHEDNQSQQRYTRWLAVE